MRNYGRLALIFLVAGVMGVRTSHGDVVYSVTGSTYSQDFNSLSALSGTHPWADDSTIVGWFGTINGITPATYNTNSGNVTTAHLGSLGSMNDPDRALGSQAGTTSTLEYGVRFTNSTSDTLTSFTVTYDGEQWSDFSTAVQSLSFGYLIGASPTLASGGYTAVPALNFASPHNVGPVGQIDGNASGNRTAGITATITNISWAPGQQLILKWTDVNDPSPPLGIDHTLAVDNFSMSATAAVPETSAFLFGGLIAAVVASVRGWSRCAADPVNASAAP